MLRPAACLAALVLLAGLGACGGAGGLRAEPEAVEFGVVRHTEVRLARVRLVNDGPAPVSFQVTPSCGCIGLGGGYRNVLDPGESTTLDVRFDSGREVPGHFQKPLDVHTNEDGGRHFQIPLRADIVRVLDVIGAQVRFGQLGGGPEDLVERMVEFKPSQGHRVELVRIEPLGTDSALLRFTSHAGEPGAALRVGVAVRPEAQRGVGAFEAAARVHLQLTAPDGSAAPLAETIHVEGFWARAAPR